MEKVLKFFQILNQVVWIVVGLATLYSIYYFITKNPLQDIMNSFSALSNPNPQQVEPLQQNPQVQKLIQDYLKSVQSKR